MVRVKGGIQTKQNHKKVLKLAKGYRMSRHKQIKKANEAVIHANQYAFNGRKLKKRNFRTLWILRINAILKEKGLKYNLFINSLKTKNIILDRKILAKIACEKPNIFDKILELVK
jgi:large subunit ribosomal protein L20